MRIQAGEPIAGCWWVICAVWVEVDSEVDILLAVRKPLVLVCCDFGGRGVGKSRVESDVESLAVKDLRVPERRGFRFRVLRNVDVA